MYIIGAYFVPCSRIHRPLKFPLSCEIAKKVVFGPPICRGRDTQISNMHFQITVTSDHVARYGLVTFSDLRD